VTAVLSRPFEAREKPIISSISTRISIPGTAVVPQPFEAREMAILGSQGARTNDIIAVRFPAFSFPRACVSLLEGPYHDFYTVVSCSRVPEKPKLFNIRFFVFKELLSTRDRRCDNFHTRDLLIIIDGKVAFTQHFASHCGVSIVSNPKKGMV
jgi:hypothetical protein